MAGIKIYGKFESATASGKLLDYSAIDNIPDILETLETPPTEASVPIINSDGKTSYKKVSELGNGSAIVSAVLIEEI